MVRSLALAMVLLDLLGCASTFHETHYFKSETRKSASAIPNYYRLTVEGYSFLSSSRYISGYFDEDTINTYFNEYTQPSQAAIIPAKTTDTGKAAGGNQNSATAITPVAQELQGKQLVMILSSNSDEIATQIGSLAQSKQFTASLVGLVTRDRYAAANTAENMLTMEKSRAKTEAQLATQLADGLSDGATKAEAETALVAFLDALAFDAGFQGAFDNLESAAKWLNFNRARFLGGGR